MIRGFTHRLALPFAGLLMTAVLVASTTAGAAPVIDQLGTDIDGAAASDKLGTSVSLSADGNTVAIGAPQNAVSNGYVRIYQLVGGVWTQKGSDIIGEADRDTFGNSVSLSADGNTVAIGAPTNDIPNNLGVATKTDAGHVRVYQWNPVNSAWEQRGGVGADIDGELAGDKSGTSVSLSADGNTVAIGAPQNDVGGTKNNAGHVRVYQWDAVNSVWAQRGGVGADIDGEAAFDQSGSTVSLSADGDTVAIGAPTNDIPDNLGVATKNQAGHVRIYEWDAVNSAWTQRGADIDGEAVGDESGWSVSLSADGNNVAIGAPFNDIPDNLGVATKGFAGHVRIYEWDAVNSAWTQRGADIDGKDADSESGWSVSISADGNNVAIGVPYAINDTATNFTFAYGQIRLYEWNGTWTQLGADTDIDSAESYDGFGDAVSLSADGSTVAVGAKFRVGGDARGQVQVFEISAAVAPTPAPASPIWRVSLDPNGGTCVDTTSRTDTWTSVFVGYRYLPNASDCARPGYTLTGWARADDPTTPIDLPILTDPSDGELRAFLAENVDLVALWTLNPAPIADVTVFANFLCGPCTSIWLIHPPVEPDVTVDITVDDRPVTCSTTLTALGFTFCEITALTPGEHTVSLISRRNTLAGPPTVISLTLKG